MQTDHKYTGKSVTGLSITMEKYLETIYRLNADAIKINNVAAHFHMLPAESAIIAKELRDKGFVKFERYGSIALTESGKQLGEFLVQRHEVLVKLFQTVNGEHFICEEVESIKHYISRNTVSNIDKYLNTNIL